MPTVPSSRVLPASTQASGLASGNGAASEGTTATRPSVTSTVTSLTASSTLNAVPTARTAIPPARTTIYVGTVTLTTPDFIRKNGVYESAYQAKVFPFFFSNEQGRMYVEISDEMLRTLEHGEPVDFKGRAVRDDGVERRLEGTATPADPMGGKLKVRVFVSKRIELIFNTTYRFSAQTFNR